MAVNYGNIRLGGMNHAGDIITSVNYIGRNYKLIDEVSNIIVPSAFNVAPYIFKGSDEDTYPADNIKIASFPSGYHSMDGVLGIKFSKNTKHANAGYYGTLVLRAGTRAISSLKMWIAVNNDEGDDEASVNNEDIFEKYAYIPVSLQGIESENSIYLGYPEAYDPHLNASSLLLDFSGIAFSN